MLPRQRFVRIKYRKQQVQMYSPSYFPSRSLCLVLRSGSWTYAKSCDCQVTFHHDLESHLGREISNRNLVTIRKIAWTRYLINDNIDHFYINPRDSPSVLSHFLPVNRPTTSWYLYISNRWSSQIESDLKVMRPQRSITIWTIPLILHIAWKIGTPVIRNATGHCTHRLISAVLILMAAL